MVHLKNIGSVKFVDLGESVDAGLNVRVDAECVALGAWLKGDGDYTIELPPTVARKLVDLLEAALADDALKIDEQS